MIDPIRQNLKFTPEQKITEDREIILFSRLATARSVVEALSSKQKRKVF